MQGVIRASLAVLNIALSIWTPKKLHMYKDRTNIVNIVVYFMVWHNSHIACHCIADVANETICFVSPTIGFELHDYDLYLQFVINE